MVPSGTRKCLREHQGGDGDPGLCEEAVLVRGQASPWGRGSPKRTRAVGPQSALLSFTWALLGQSRGSGTPPSAPGQRDRQAQASLLESHGAEDKLCADSEGKTPPLPRGRAPPAVTGRLLQLRHGNPCPRLVADKASKQREPSAWPTHIRSSAVGCP